MKKQDTQKKKEAYTKPMLYTHEPLRNITARGPDGTAPSVPPSGGF